MSQSTTHLVTRYFHVITFKKRGMESCIQLVRDGYKTFNSTPPFFIITIHFIHIYFFFHFHVQHIN